MLARFRVSRDSWMKNKEVKFSIEMLDLVKKSSYDYIFAGINGSVLASTKMIEEIYTMCEENGLWKKLQEAKEDQEAAINSIQENLIKRGYKCELKIENETFYLIVRP